ncbi:MAG: hypothetical protein E6767_09855 [Dysgonomonas sp.]|nr:hypothetical protein [Dysgonomonas sp.]
MEDSIKSEFITFIDDSLCIYTQTFHCDMNEKYQNTNIQCKYRVEKKLIILNSIECPDYLKKKECYTIPDSILKNCNLIYADTPTDPFDLDIRAKITKADLYGQINNINNSDTLLFYKNNIFYAKVLSCLPVEVRRSNFQFFNEKGKKRLDNKILMKLMKAQKIPINSTIN